MTPDPIVQLERWSGPWDESDPDANFKAEVATWSKADPMETLAPFAEALGIPIGAVCRYILSRWSAEGSAGLLELGPTMVDRLWRFCEEAEAAGDGPEARLAAYDGLRQVISWLRTPLS